jgi:hypothetical protein
MNKLVIIIINNQRRNQSIKKKTKNETNSTKKGKDKKTVGKIVYSIVTGCSFV